MAQTVLTCKACTEEVGLQWSDEEPPIDGCTANGGGDHAWVGGQRVRLIAEVILPDGADADGFADSVSDFLAGLQDPQAFALGTVVEYNRPFRIKKVGDNEYEVANIQAGDGTFEDATISKTDNPDEPWAVDIFAAHIDNPDDAHRYSETFATFQEALDYLIDTDGEN